MMVEQFLFYFTVLGVVCWLAFAWGLGEEGRFRCLTWSRQLHLGLALALFLLLCFAPSSEVSQMVRPPVEHAICYTHYLLFGALHA